MSFLNPYDFIPFDHSAPVAKRIVSESDLSGIDHSVYAGISGRVVFRLTNPKTPLFIGSSRGKDSENGIPRFKRYEVNQHPAIPGSTLRGLIGSLYEAMTNSAMRALSNHELAHGHAPRLFDGLDKIDRDLRPLHPGRALLTPAELLFGYVDDLRGSPNERARALSGRVRFSDAPIEFLPADPMRWVTLKFQNAPNPKCSVLYCDELNRPNGRKFYLHSDDPGTDHWTEGSPNRKRNVQIQPLPAGCVFWSHLDFDNLLEIELRMLFASLRPDPLYTHRLGRAKPFGFGSVELTPIAWFCTDRNNRYGPRGLEEFRYSKSNRFNLCDRHIVWPPRYAKEAETFQKARVAHWQDIISNALKTVPPQTLNAIRLLGDPKNSNLPVKYPGGVWLEANKATLQPYRLGQINAESTEIPEFPDDATT